MKMSKEELWNALQQDKKNKEIEKLCSKNVDNLIDNYDLGEILPEENLMDTLNIRGKGAVAM